MNKITVQDTKIGIKDVLMVLHETGNTTEDCISSIQTALIYNTSLPLKDCKAKFDNIKKQEFLLTEKVTDIISNDQSVEQYVTLPGHFSRIASNIEKLNELVDKKNQGNILFSDKAVNEAIFLLQRLIEMLRPATDMILARNIFLSTYVQKSQTGLSKMADEYATLHEERLVTGECNPVASSLYLNMLDQIKSIAWHIKEITVKLAAD